MGRMNQDLRTLIASLRRDLRQEPEATAGRRLRQALALLEAASDALEDVAALRVRRPVDSAVGS